MNKNQFNLLVYLERNKNKKITQKKLSNELNISVGTVNSAISFLIEKGYVDSTKNSEYIIKEKAYHALEPHKVQRAIFFAAGFGSRLVPVSYNTPKPLIRVKGVRMIDTLLDAVLAAGINDITIVRGFLKEQFDTLLPKYPMLKFVDNDSYNEANNISSAFLVKDLLENTLVLESDLILSDPNIIRKYEYKSNYRSKEVDRTNDWCFDTKSGVITKVKIGGENTHEMVGISFWDAKDGKKLSEDIEKSYKSPGGKEKYWDEVALKDHIENYSINVYPVTHDSIIEVDTYSELCDIDGIYKVN